MHKIIAEPVIWEHFSKAAKHLYRFKETKIFQNQESQDEVQKWFQNLEVQICQ